MASHCKRRRQNEPACAKLFSVRVCGVGGQQLDMSMPGSKTIRDVKRSVEKIWQVPTSCQKLVKGVDILSDADQLSKLRTEANSEGLLEVTFTLILDVSDVLHDLTHPKAAQRKDALLAMQKLGKRCGEKAKTEVMRHLKEAYTSEAETLWSGLRGKGTRCAGIHALAKMVDKGDSEAVRLVAYMCLLRDGQPCGNFQGDSLREDRPSSEQVRSAALHALLSMADVRDQTVLAAMAYSLNSSMCQEVIQFAEAHLLDYLPDMYPSSGDAGVKAGRSHDFRRLVLKCITGFNPLLPLEQASNMNAATMESFTSTIIAAVRGRNVLQDVVALYGGDGITSNTWSDGLTWSDAVSGLTLSLMNSLYTLRQAPSIIIHTLGCLREDDYCLRCAAEQLFDHVLDTDAKVMYLEDTSACVRTAAVHALAPCVLLGDVEVSKAVTKCLDDPSADVRDAAEIAISLAGQ